MSGNDMYPVFQMCLEYDREKQIWGYVFSVDLPENYTTSPFFTIPTNSLKYDVEYYFPGEFNKEMTEFVLKKKDENNLELKYDKVTILFAPERSEPISKGIDLPYIGNHKEFVQPYDKFAILSVVGGCAMLDHWYTELGFLLVGLTPVFGAKR